MSSLPKSRETPVLDPLSLYLLQMTEETLLSAEEEVQLAKAIEAGKIAAERLSEDGWSEAIRFRLAAIQESGRVARTRMIQANTRLVVSIAKKYRGLGLQFLDLIQEGNLGLITAVDRFDYRFGNRFSTYASRWIRQAIANSLANDGGAVRIPAHLVSLLNQLRQASSELTQAKGREPTPEEIGERMGLTPERVRELQNYSLDPLHLDQPAGAEFDSKLADFVEDIEALKPDDEADRSTMYEEIIQALETLSPREADILRLRFGLQDGRPRTLAEVGGILGVSHERIRQLQKAALRKLHRSYRAGRLRQHLP